jgi:hypothetical protein
LLVAYIVSGSAGIVLVVLAIFIGVKIGQAKSILENNLNERQVGIFKTWSTRIDHYKREEDFKNFNKVKIGHKPKLVP